MVDSRYVAEALPFLTQFINQVDDFSNTSIEHLPAAEGMLSTFVNISKKSFYFDILNWRLSFGCNK